MTLFVVLARPISDSFVQTRDVNERAMQISGSATTSSLNTRLLSSSDHANKKQQG